MIARPSHRACAQSQTPRVCRALQSQLVRVGNGRGLRVAILNVETRRSSRTKSIIHFLLDLLIGYADSSAFADGLDASADFFIPSVLYLVARSGSIQIQQQSDECQSLMPRKLNDFLGDFFDAGGNERCLSRKLVRPARLLGAARLAPSGPPFGRYPRFITVTHGGTHLS
jgi:hypothetical protein